jgi:PAS domain S-box-containing protein
MNHLSFVLLEDSQADAELIRSRLQEAGLEFTLRRVDSREAYLSALEQEGIDIILSDYSLPSFDGMSALLLAREKRPEVPFLFVSGTIGEERAVETFKNGATDYVLKDHLTRLVPAVRRALEEARDRAARRRAEQDLLDTNRRLQMAAASDRLGIWEWDPASDLLVADARTLEILGHSQGSFNGRLQAWEERLHPEDRRAAMGAMRSALLEAGLACEFRLQCPDGQVKAVRCNALVFRDAEGRPVRMTGILKDITEQKSLESQFRQAQKMESVGRLAGGVAHDFNKMLQVIGSYVEMAMRKMDSTQPVYAFLQQIQKAAQRSADLTRQLLAFARKQTASPRVLDLNEAVSGMLKMLQRLIGEDIDLVWLPAHGLWRVRVDPTQIDQILANLAVNARDAIAGAGKLTIETANAAFDEAYCARNLGFLPGEYVRLTVSDDGQGMSEEIKSHLFEPFFTTKGVGKGTGLGLATVYGIVRQNGGFINVYSEPGQGSTFKIYLRRFQGQAVPGGAAPDAGPQGGTETVLLVEDEQMILASGKTMLEELGYTVLAASTPAAALHLAGEYNGPIHLLITDLILPGMHGTELAGKIASLHPGIRCLYMSGYTANVITHHGILEEGVHFLPKPFTMKDLAAKIREALGRAG